MDLELGVAVAAVLEALRATRHQWAPLACSPRPQLRAYQGLEVVLAAGEGDRVELDVAPGCVREGSAVDADVAAEAVVRVLSASFSLRPWRKAGKELLQLLPCGTCRSRPCSP